MAMSKDKRAINLGVNQTTYEDLRILSKLHEMTVNACVRILIKREIDDNRDLIEANRSKFIKLDEGETHE